MRWLVTHAGALLLGLFGTLLATLFSNEALGFLSKLSRALVEHAVTRLPEGMREQYREEWLATLEYEGRDGKKLSELKAALEAWQSADATATAHTPELDPKTRADIERTLDRLLFRPVVIAIFYNLLVRRSYGLGIAGVGPAGTLLADIPFWFLMAWACFSIMRGFRYIAKLEKQVKESNGVPDSP